MTEATTTRTDPDANSTTPQGPPWTTLTRFSAVKLLLALVLLIASSPFIEQFKNGLVIDAVLTTGVLVTATLAMGSRRWTFAVAMVLVLPALTARWFTHLRPDLVRPEVFHVTGLVFVGFVAANLVRFILRAPRVDSEVLCAGISGYLLLGLLWAFAYKLVGNVSPDAFWFASSPVSGHPMQGFTATYFSYTTLCTVGYGDIAPVSPAARMLAMMEAMTGTFYVAIMIARLVALHSARRDFK